MESHGGGGFAIEPRDLAAPWTRRARQAARGKVTGGKQTKWTEHPPLAPSSMFDLGHLGVNPIKLNQGALRRRAHGRTTPSNTTREKPGIGHVANPGCNPGMNRRRSTPGMRTRVSKPRDIPGKAHIPGFSWLLDHRYRRQATARGDRPGIRPGMWACACAHKSKSYSQPRFTMKA